MAKHVVWITDDRFGDGGRIEREVLDGLAVDLRVNTDLPAPAGTFTGAVGLLVNQYSVGGDLIRSIPGLRIISRYGVGYDNVDIPAATTCGVRVAYVPDYASEDVSDHAVALLLACVRAVPRGDRRLREGGWNLVGERRLYRTAGRTLGIVGYGRIGSAVHRKMRGFGLSRVLVHDPEVPASTLSAAGCVPVDLDTLLGESDYVTIHAPLSESTRGMIGPRELELMKPGAYLVNTARGAVVNQAALAEALRRGRIAGAALDVFEHEPLDASSPLRTLDNVVLSSHMAWYTEESLVELRTKAAANVRSVLRGEEPAYPLNDPARGGKT